MQDFSAKRGVVPSEVLLPENAPEQWSDRELLWNATQMVERWRERWAEDVNERLAELHIDARIDHRSLEAQGIDLEPQSQIGTPAQRIEGKGIEAAERAEMHREIARNNGERIIADPNIAVDAITQQQPTFKQRDMAKLAHRHSDGIEQFSAVMGAMGNSPDLVELIKDSFGNDRFTTRDMIATDQRLHRAAELMAEKELHEVNDRDTEAALARADQRGLIMSGEQTDALTHVTDGRDLGIVVGSAGTGKSAMLGVAREVWEAEGYDVRGVTLSGIAAENLESGSGIASRTIASIEHGWKPGRDMLTARDVLVIDEADMVGTRQMERVLSHPQEVGAKVVLVGDPEQLQSIEADAAFRSIYERHGGVEIHEVRRQREDWQRHPTRDLATARTGNAIRAYDAHDMVHEAQTREEARDDPIDRWDRDRQMAPHSSRIILTHTNAEVRELNEAARDGMREAGDLGEDACYRRKGGTPLCRRGSRHVPAKRARAWSRWIGHQECTLATIEEVSQQSMTVRTDDGRCIDFDLKDYDRIDHGYAATIHKAQGMTVDRTHVLATPGMDAHGSYVSLSRHRDGTELHYGRDDFASQGKLINTLSRDRSKDMATDYERADPAQGFAERRGITFRERMQRVVEIVRQVPEKVRGMLVDARTAFDKVRLHGWEDAEAAYAKDDSLAREAGGGKVNRAIRALQLETEIRTGRKAEPGRRADRFVERWQKLDQTSQRQYATGDYSGYRAARAEMGNMAMSLERDPQMEFLLEGRRKDLGIDMDTGMGIGRSLALSHGLGRGRGLGL